MKKGIGRTKPERKLRREVVLKEKRRGKGNVNYFCLFRFFFFQSFFSFVFSF